MADAFRAARPTFRDLHLASATGAIEMDVLAPLMSPTGQPVGAVVLKIDPQIYLYPILQKWPEPSLSAESLLVRRDGDEVVWLNDLRFQPSTALQLRMPITATQMPGVMAALGVQGTFRGIDYRGVDVFSALQPVPDSPWSLVAKEDTAEALRFLGPITWSVGVSLACLLAVVGVSGRLAWQQAQNRYYRAVAAAEAGRLALARHFEYLVKYANDVILLTDAGFRVVEANDRALETYGYAREEMLKLTLSDLAAPEDAAASQALQRQLQGAGSDQREAVQRRRDGSVFPAEISARATEVEGRAYYQAILRDITDRKRAEQVIRRQTEQLQAQTEELQAQNEELAAQQEDLLDARAGLEARVRERTDELQETNAVLEAEVEERCRAEEQARQNAERLSILADVSQILVAAGPDCQRSMDAMARAIGQCLRDVCVIHLLTPDARGLDCVAVYPSAPESRPGDSRAPAARLPKAWDDIAGLVWQTKEPMYMPTLPAQDSPPPAPPELFAGLEQMRVQGLIAVPMLAQGDILGTLVIYRLTDMCPYTRQDLALLQGVADRVALAVANSRLYQDLRTALAQEQSTRQQLIQAEKLGALGRMVSSVAHELNNPLQTITNCFFLMRQQLAPDSDVQEYVAMAQAETKRLVKLVAQLRELYRPQPTSPWVACRLATLVGEVHALVAPPLRDAHVRWLQPDGSPDCLVQAVPDRLKQVFINLTMNALEAMQPSSGELRIAWTLSDDGRQVGVSFQDTGPGIEPEHLSRLFEPFYTTKVQGVGLGLAICHEIVREHGGRITVSSEPGQGARFTVWLPLAPQDRPGPEATGGR